MGGNDADDATETDDAALKDDDDAAEENDEADDKFVNERGVMNDIGTSSGSSRGVTSICCICTIGVAGGSTDDSRLNFFSG